MRLPELQRIPLRTPPMPDVAPALLLIPDAIAALQRAAESWNRAQVEVHLAAADQFLAHVRATLERCKKREVA